MKKNAILLLMTFAFLFSCSKDDSKEETIPTEAQLESFQEPFVDFGTPRTEIIAMFGEKFDTERNDLSLGYWMVYDSKRNGEYQRAYSLDNEMKLWETEVRYYGTAENLKLLKNSLKQEYGSPEIGGGIGLIEYRYSTNYAEITLSYIDGSTEAIINYREL